MNTELIPPALTRWSRPSEFDGEGKEITIEDFQTLKFEEVLAEANAANRLPPKFAPRDGFVRRLTFYDNEYGGERTLDINSPKFQNDLSGKGIQKGSKGVLRRIKPEKGAFRWEWLSK